MHNTVQQYINVTMEQVKIFKKVIDSSNKINMTYNYITDEISYDYKRIAQILRHHPQISLEEYVITFTLHELGHALDRKNLLNSYDQTLEWYKLSKKLTPSQKKINPLYLELSYLEDKTNLNFELVAWENAIRLNDQYNLVPNNVLENLKLDSLLTYQANYIKSKELFNERVEIPIAL